MGFYVTAITYMNWKEEKKKIVADEIWEYVEEYKDYGSIAFKEKYKDYVKYAKVDF